MKIIDGVRVIYRLSEDDLLRAKALRTEKRIRDERTALDNAKAEGEAKGEAKGIAAMIAQMRKNGIDEELIDKMVESLNMNHENH